MKTPQPRPLKLNSCLVHAGIAMGLLGAPMARADVVTLWNKKAGEFITAAGMGTPPANRVMAIVQTATYEATNAITRSYPPNPNMGDTPPDASVEAAVAAANHAVLTRLVPSQRAAIDSAYEAALSHMADSKPRHSGVAVGEKAASVVLTQRADDGPGAADLYRPVTSPGTYVPTVIPAAPHWPQRRPWLMTQAAQFRPAPPPPLGSEQWARDYNEIKTLGGKVRANRSAEQTEIARFWEATLPPIYHGLVRSVAERPGRNVTQNARLFAAVTQASDDALIAVFDAKYHYAFWRPITAIRNGDTDGNDATERDASWLPLIDTPMHPEYPCAHCIVAAAIGVVLKADIGSGPETPLTTASPTAGGSTRSWPSISAFVQEVSDARVYDGVHYRNSTEVGKAMGRQIGALSVARHLSSNLSSN